MANGPGERRGRPGSPKSAGLLAWVWRRRLLLCRLAGPAHAHSHPRPALPHCRRSGRPDAADAGGRRLGRGPGHGGPPLAGPRSCRRRRRCRPRWRSSRARRLLHARTTAALASPCRTRPRAVGRSGASKRFAPGHSTRVCQRIARRGARHPGSRQPAAAARGGAGGRHGRAAARDARSADAPGGGGQRAAHDSRRRCRARGSRRRSRPSPRRAAAGPELRRGAGGRAPQRRPSCLAAPSAGAASVLPSVWPLLYRARASAAVCLLPGSCQLHAGPAC